MRILFCNYEYPPLGGGGGVVNAMLAEELARHHDVTVLTSQGLALPRHSHENGVRIVRVPVFFRSYYATANIPSMFAYIPMGIREGKNLLTTGSYDVINTHFVVPTGPVGDALARYGGIPNVLSVHGGDLFDPSKWTSPHRHAFLRMWIRKLLRRADRVVGQSRNTLDNVAKYYDPSLSTVRIPLGIKRPPRVQGNRADYGFSSDDILLATVGRLVARKAVDQLVLALEQLDNKKVHLLLIGNGPKESSLRELAEVRGVGSYVHFFTEASDVEKFKILMMSDIYVSSSQHEGFGLVYLEAMASELPIVCYDNGGQTDFLADNVTGFLLPLNDLSGLTNGIRRLCSDKDLRSRFAQTNLERVEDLFIDNCARRYESLFMDVIERHKSGVAHGIPDRI